jgi:hypothetical protein
MVDSPDRLRQEFKILGSKEQEVDNLAELLSDGASVPFVSVQSEQ